MKKYNSLNGLRAYAAIGIVLMHVKANLIYKFDNVVIDSFTQFVYLFMMVSAFVMCCGYYEKIKNNKISVNDFYKKRFSRILPIFGILVLIEVIYNRNIESVFEGFADLTLAFGLLPNNNLSVVGVVWFVGLVFLFYMLFPYFVFLIDNKKRAWKTLIIALIYNFLMISYFGTSKFVVEGFALRHTFLYSFIFFVIGGIIYLYKDEISSKLKSWYILGFIILGVIMYFILPSNSYLLTIEMVIIFAMLLIYAIVKENSLFLDNKFTEIVSKNSMEIYLSHMFVFRILGKIKLEKIISNEIVYYIVISIFTLIGAYIVSIILNKIVDFIQNTKNNKMDKSINKV